MCCWAKVASLNLGCVVGNEVIRYFFLCLISYVSYVYVDFQKQPGNNACLFYAVSVPGKLSVSLEAVELKCDGSKP